MQKRVLALICDDTFGALLEKRLASRNFSVAMTSTLEDLERKAAKRRPQALLIDIACAIDLVGLYKYLASLPTLQQIPYFFYAKRLRSADRFALKRTTYEELFSGAHTTPTEIAQRIAKALT